jgi:PAS domain S-box-containing protein
MSSSEASLLSAGSTALPLVFDSPSHTVQFYQNDGFLIDELTRLVGTALISGDAAIIIATEAHRHALAQNLAARGLNVTRATVEGRFVSLDAEETLTHLMLDQMPDPQRFGTFVGEAIAKAKAAAKIDNPCTVIFGEMVALLWAAGKYDAAVRLEELWNGLANSHSFTLRCAYPMNGFQNDANSELFTKICAAHTSVLPTAQRGNLFNDDDRLRTIAALQQKLEVLEHAKALSASEQRFQLLVEAAQDYAIFMLDPGGRITSWNVGGERIKGYKASEIIGKHISCFYPEEEARAAKPQRLLELARREGRSEDEGWRVRKDGTKFWANVVITALRDKNGQVIGFSKVTRDFTERMQTQRALQDSKRSLQDSEKSLRELSLSLLRTQDEERRRIGRDLHDCLGQYLAALKMKLDAGQSVAARGQAIDKDVFAQCSQLTEESIKELRTICYLLYPPMLEELGLKSAISWYLEGFTKRSGIQTTFEVLPDFERLAQDVELALFRVLQESLTNVHRHSGSPTAAVRLLLNDETVVLEISDQGKGTQITSFEKDGRDWISSVGVGLRGMNERVSQLGGKLELSSSHEGTIVSASVPVPKNHAAPSTA